MGAKSGDAETIGTDGPLADQEIVDAWAEALKEGLLHHRSLAAMGPPQTTAKSVLLAWLEWSLSSMMLGPAKMC